MKVPFPIEQVELNAPLPVNVVDPHGVLLLRRGEIIRNEAHRDLLKTHGPMVDEEEYRQWTFRYTAAIDKKLRGNERLEAIAGVARPMGVQPTRNEQELSALERWTDLHTRLSLLLVQGEQAQDFERRLQQLESRIDEVLRARVDDSLFVLVQLLLDRAQGYSASHALLSAVLCRLVGTPLLAGHEPLQRSLMHAALTMNIGMSKLQDELALRLEPLDEALRARVNRHPLDGVRILQALGVGDGLWLDLVRHHHQQPRTPLPDLTGCAPTDLAAHLLALADVFVARISPRASRRSQPAHVAARDAYLTQDGQAAPLGAAFIKTVGVHIPGSYVQLENGELAVVVRRGRRANAPLAFALVGRQGLPMGEPALRDTSEPAFQIKAGVAADEVRVRVNPSKLLARL